MGYNVGQQLPVRQCCYAGGTPTRVSTHQGHEGFDHLDVSREVAYLAV